MSTAPRHAPSAPEDAGTREDWLRLIRSGTVGPHSFWQLLARFGDAGAALDAVPDLARRAGGRAAPGLAGRDAIRREIDATHAFGARFVFCGEADYPPLLAQVEAPPPVLAVRGDPAIAGARTVAIVGARNASAAGRKMARLLAGGLGAAGVTVASGLARGIDAEAHEASLATGTVAVIAGGIDTAYPRENARLYDAIAERGAIFSEMPFGAEPLARHFPRRNRLISGMAAGIAVVEAALRSGSLITARFAAEQGRDVFAVPGSPLDQRAQGTNRLIRDGAQLVQSADDILDALEPQFGEPRDLFAPQAGVPMDAPVPADGVPEGAHDTIAALLAPAPVDLDDLVRASGLSASVVGAVVLELELAARAVRYPGGRVASAG